MEEKKLVEEMIAETTEDVAEGNSNLVLKVGLIGVGIVGSVIAYKKVVKPLIKKYQDKKAAKDESVEVETELLEDSNEK